jgi:hypothetical protein
MNTKNILVSFLLIASVLLLTATASATEIVNSSEVKVNDIEAYNNEISVVAGEEITVKVTFKANISTSDVKLKAKLEGDEKDSVATTSVFDVVEGKTYTKTLTLEVPEDFNDEDLNNELSLDLKLWNSDDETEFGEITLNIQREPYKLAIKSVITSTAEAGKTMPIDLVLKNIGYNDVDDVYVIVSIPELGISKSGYFGEIVTGYSESLPNAEDDEEDTVNGKLTLDIPPYVKSGVYTINVTVKTEDLESDTTREITVYNRIPDVAIKSGNDLILLNPTDRLTVYVVKYLANEEVVVVPADSSKSISIHPSLEGFDVTVYSGTELLSTVKFSGSSETNDLTSPGFVITIVLAVIFLVLLVVLIILLTKKPQKAEEFGESYY